MPYNDELAYLFSLKQFGLKLGLANISSICALLNNPQDSLKTIHIGGTNGKGSTAAMVTSILQMAGYKTGLYTSPHLKNFTERIQIDNVPISKEKVVRYTEIIRDCIEYAGIVPTFFEFTTALAFLYFADEGVDIAIIEVGLGGRLDATNIITPVVSVITNIGHDHREHLGDNLEDIVKEKCGILKESVPLVTTEMNKHIWALIEEKAEKLSSKTYTIGKDFHVSSIKMDHKGSKFLYRGLRNNLHVRSPLPGRHQIFNAGTALCVAEIICEKGFCVDEKHLVNGIEKTFWPGRLEWIDSSPRVLLDGAHNCDGIIALCNFIRDVLKRENPSARIIPVFGVLKDKDVQSMIKELGKYVSDMIITTPNTERGLSIDILQRVVEDHAITFRIGHDIEEALSIAFNIARPTDIILVTGSLYLVGEARDMLTKSPIKMVAG